VAIPKVAFYWCASCGGCEEAVLDLAEDLHETYYMGLVDKNDKVNLYDGDIRVVTPTGEEFVKFKPRDYLKHIEEHVESWSYTKFTYLKNVGWNGFTDGKDSGVYRVAPLARLNVFDGILNMVEMAFRACDPSFACATHSLPGQMPLIVSIFDQDKELVRKVSKGINA